MARIILVYKEFPAPSVGHAGGQGVFRLIERLHRRGHDVHLVARLRSEEAPLVEETRAFCTHVETVPHHSALSGPFPWAWLRSYLSLRRAAARALREQQPDLLFVEFAQTAAALVGLERSLSALRPHDVNWFLLQQQLDRMPRGRRWIAAGLSRLLRWFEPWLCRRYDQVVAISEGDRRLLAPHCGARPVLLLPLTPAPTLQREVAPAVEPGPNVLFVGAMYRSVNVEAVQWFVEAVWPSIVAQVPDARFYVVGYRPPPEIRALDDGEHIFVTGFVDDLAPWYRAAAVFVSPLLVAGGLLQKILDALAAGVPVVATPVSNHGVGGVPDEHLLVAQDAAAFADGVVRLLQEPGERARLSRAGRRFVQEQYNLDDAIARWEASWD
jgi:glycosyltransferase involved in cell wall biosynthesis